MDKKILYSILLCLFILMPFQLMRLLITKKKEDEDYQHEFEIPSFDGMK